MVNKMQGVNYDILVKRTAMNLEGMRMPFVSQREEHGGQQAEAAASSSAGLPKPYISSAFGSSTGSGEFVLRKYRSKFKYLTNWINMSRKLNKLKFI